MAGGRVISGVNRLVCVVGVICAWVDLGDEFECSGNRGSSTGFTHIWVGGRLSKSIIGARLSG